MRRLTISRSYQPRRRNSGILVSQIRLAGRWLERAGFARGSAVRVDVRDGQIILTAEGAR